MVLSKKKYKILINTSIISTESVFNAPQSFLIQLQWDFQGMAIPNDETVPVSGHFLKSFQNLKFRYVLFTSCLDQGPSLRKFFLHLLGLGVHNFSSSIKHISKLYMVATVTLITLIINHTHL